jgi:FkbM family methyltransferase
MKLIDIGAFNGDSALHFISYPDIDSIYAYDPNDDYLELWDAIERFYPSVSFKNLAVYTNNGSINFYKQPRDLSLGSTLMKDKVEGSRYEIVNVDCVDILDIIPDEPFCLKLDAEGAEYDILERLIESGKHTLVDRLYVEWHDSKMTSDNFARQVAIINYFGKRIKQWL